MHILEQWKPQTKPGQATHEEYEQEKYEQELDDQSYDSERSAWSDMKMMMSRRMMMYTSYLRPIAMVTSASMSARTARDPTVTKMSSVIIMRLMSIIMVELSHL